MQVLCYRTTSEHFNRKDSLGLKDMINTETNMGINMGISTVRLKGTMDSLGCNITSQECLHNRDTMPTTEAREQLTGAALPFWVRWHVAAVSSCYSSHFHLYVYSALLPGKFPTEQVIVSLDELMKHQKKHSTSILGLCDLFAG